MSSTEVAWNPCSTKSVSAASRRRCRRAPRRDSTAGATELIAPTLRRERARDHEPLDLRRTLEAASTDAALAPPPLAPRPDSLNGNYAASVREITSRWISDVPSKRV